jgi:hypothetical protein
MSLFCFLWMPLFYLFWRALQAENSGTGGVWALLLGTIAAIARLFLDDFVYPEGFGLSRFISACVDIIVLPALLPILVYLILILLRALSSPYDFASFALIWMIPAAAFRAVAWSAGSDPVLLVLVPLLWTAIAVGISFFIGLFTSFIRWYVIIPCALGILTLPFAAAVSWWAFYSQLFYWGLLFLGISMIPFLLSIILSWIKLTR